ncbi:hypothetical protein [Aeromonas dhakensis]|uniref:hypothetical protein n=1 Tax=Aeromonas dhakensis TaxID=196024 RepID=UPI00300E571B
MDITNENINNLISDCWKSVQEKVEAGDPLSSEKTLCFLFAMALFSKVGGKLTIDFENQCYEDVQGTSKYLDLLFYTDKNFKVAIEFKLPQRSKNGSSNQTQTRELVYRDLARLNHLKTSPLKVSVGYFLMAINEDAYLNKGSYKKVPDYVIYEGHSVNESNILSVDGLSLSGMTFKFGWQNIHNTGTKNIKTGDYAWLTPIRV